MSNDRFILPRRLVSYGPNTNCTLALCSVQYSTLGYRPSTEASGVFIALFAVAAVAHVAQGVRWKTWGFMVCMAVGCIDEIIGYSARLMLYHDPFNFYSFIIQILCITTAPVFYCAAIYVTLSRTIEHLDRSLAPFNPRLLYWVFIPSDIISLALQAAGGADSSITSGASKAGVDVSLAGLSFQVITLVVFILVAADYMVRYLRTQNRPKTTTRLRLYLVFLAASTVLILGRCVYRIDELSDGYSGPLFRDENLFYAFESVFIVVAVFFLNIGHPGIGMTGVMTRPVLQDEEARVGPGREEGGKAVLAL